MRCQNAWSQSSDTVYYILLVADFLDRKHPGNIADLMTSRYGTAAFRISW
jgi:hypothetical protein